MIGLGSDKNGLKLSKCDFDNNNLSDSLLLLRFDNVV